MFGFLRGGGRMGRVDTIIGQGAELRGALNDKGTIYLDGKMEGNLSSDDGIVIGVHGQIRGNLHSKNVEVAGKVNGNITATQRVDLLPTAVLHGDIETPRLIIGEGAWFEGRCEMDQVIESAEIKTFKKANPA